MENNLKTFVHSVDSPFCPLSTYYHLVVFPHPCSFVIHLVSFLSFFIKSLSVVHCNSLDYCLCTSFGDILEGFKGSLV